MTSPTHHRFTFVPATKAGSFVRLALMGPSGSGKTYTALRLAAALGTNPGLIDTERQRSRKYADLFPFARVDMDRFAPADLTRAVLDAAAQNINPLIIDTMSPFWSGPDGMLDSVGQAATSSFEGWKKMRPVERQMMDALLGYPGHIIVNLKVKMKYVVEPNDKGKMEPRRLGMEPEQRSDIEYDFDIVGDMDHATLRVGSTCLCPELTGKVFDQPGGELADLILAWLARDAVGEPLNPITVAAWATDPDRTRAELKTRYDALEAAGQLAAVVHNPWSTGDRDEFMPVGELIKRVAADLRRAEAASTHPLGAAVTGAAA